MKKYIRTLKELMKVSKSDFVLYGVASLIGAVIGIVMVFVIMAVDGTGEDYGELGSLFALLIGVIALIFGGIYGTQTDFNMAISMGKIRKHFVPAKYVVLVMETLMLIAIAALVGWVESVLYNAVYPTAVNELHVSAWLDYPLVIVGAALGIPAITMLFGTLLMIFGQKFFWVIWFLWMFGCIGFPRMVHAATESPESGVGRFANAVADLVTGLPVGALTAGVSVIVAAIVVVDYILLRKQRVTA